MQEIDLSNNVFTGTISNSLSNLFNLEALILHNNKFEGTLPGALFENNTVFNDIEISSNKLTGEVPPGLWTLPALNRMMIDKNDFTGARKNYFSNSFVSVLSFHYLPYYCYYYYLRERVEKISAREINMQHSSDSGRR